MKKVASDKEGEGKEFLNDTYKELRDVLAKRAKEAQKLAEGAKKDVEKEAKK